MGRPKPLLPWHGVTLVEYQIASLIDAGVSQVIVVLGHEHEAIAPHVSGDGVHSVMNVQYRQGKATSVRAGLTAVDTAATDILLLAVDQPRPAKIVAAIVSGHEESSALITAPRYRGRGGHPLVFSASLRSELEAITEDHQGIRALFKTHPNDITEVPIDDPIVCLDLNTPEEYEIARSRYGELL